MADQTFAVHCGFFDAINSDRTYSADEMNRPYRRIISNGVFATPQGNPSTDLQVVESTGMNIICKAGEGLFADKWFENPFSIVITVPNNTSTVPRIDSVLVQVDTRTSGRVGNIVHRTGTPASSPVPPAINQTEGVVEYRLANIRVNAGVTSIQGRYITDRRGSSDCPWVTSLIYQVDTSTLYDQWQAAYAEYFEEEKAIWDAWYAQLTEDLDVSMTLDRHTNTVTTTAQTTGYIPIGLAYNHNTDILEVYINGLRAIEGTHYVVVDDTTILVENQLQIGQEVTFVVMRSVISGSATNIMVLLQELESQIAGIAGGTPTVVDSMSDMTDTDKIYILSSDSKWYYYSATSEDWVIGGTYGGVPTDTTLSISGSAADAKAVGDALVEKADADDVTAVQTALAGKADYAEIGDLSQLTTTAKNNLVSAINEAAEDAKAVDDALAEIKNDSAEVYQTNTVFFTRKIDVSGSGNYVYKDFCTVTPVDAGDSFKVEYDGYTGGTSEKPIWIYFKKADGSNAWGSSGTSGFTVTLKTGHITAGVVRVEFRFYPAAGTALPSGSASISNVKITKVSEPELAFTELATNLIGNIANEKVEEEHFSDSRNLFNLDWEKATYDANGVYTPQTSANSFIGVPPEIPITGGEKYTVSFGNSEVEGRVVYYVHQFDSSGNRITFNNFEGTKTYTFKAVSNAVMLGLHIYSPGNTDWTKLIPEWTQVEAGITATSYIAHKTVKSENIDGYGVIKSNESYVSEIGLLSASIATVKTVAHRGDDIDAPQCTAPSYIIAKMHGVTVAENDIWTSEDGELIVWHDTTLARLGNLVDINGYLMYTDGTDYYYVNGTNVYAWDGTDYVASSVTLSSLTRCAGANYGVNSTYASIGLSLGVLKRIDFGVYKGVKFAGTQILTFEEWVMLCKQLGLAIYIDNKLTYTEALLTRAANIVKKCGMGNHASWLGLSTGLITVLRNIIPDARCGTLSHPTSSLIEAYAPYNAGGGFFFNGNAKDGMTAETIQLGLSAGFDVEVWYVDYGNDTKETIFEKIREAVSYGVTAMTLDHYRVNDAFDYLYDKYK